MKPYERQALLDRVERESATVGVRIPERLVLDGEVIALRDRVFALERMDGLSRAQQEERESLLVALRRRRTELLEELEHGDIDQARGKALLDRIVRLDRARSGLRSAGEDTDIEEEMREREVADAERWQSFIKRTRRGIDRSIDR